MIVDLSKYDFRLLEVQGDIYALEANLKLIDGQIERIQKKERLRLNTYIRSEGLSPEDPDYHLAKNEYEEHIEILLPRFFRGPFLVSLFSVYESAVTEIAQLMQKTLSHGISLNDIKGSFLERAKKYYKHILKFELCSDPNTWQQIMMLAELRHAIAHVNGRLEMLNKDSRKKIANWESEKVGLTTYSGYIVCDAKIVSELFQSVRFALEDLMLRYKQWDDSNNQKTKS
jgi:hypothetical protein